jgi:hypothetical protein
MVGTTRKTTFQEITNTLDHLKNHPPKTAHFNWIFDKAFPSLGKVFFN